MMADKGIEIEVTQDDIRKATIDLRDTDPLVVAILRTFPYVPYVSTAYDYITIGRVKYVVNDVLYAHLTDWDQYKVFHPHTYRLKRAQEKDAN